MSLNNQRLENHDRYGPMGFTIGDFKKRLPRSPISTISYISVNKMVLSFVGKDPDDGVDTYLAMPCSMTDAFSGSESIIIVRKHIWEDFFSLSANYTYSNDRHYPMAFKIYLRDKLNIEGIYSEEDLQMFISYVRNAIFHRIIYAFEPMLLAAAYKISKVNARIKMYNPESYTIKANWKHWLK